MLAWAEAAAGLLGTLLWWLAGVAVAAMMLHVTADIAGKYFLHAPIHGTLEIATYYYMPLVALAPLAVVQRRREHILVELFTQRFSVRLNALLDAVMALLTAAFFALIAWFALVEALRKTARNEFVYVVLFDLPVWPARWVVPVVAALVVAIALLQAMAGIGRALGRGARPAPSL